MEETRRKGIPVRQGGRSPRVSVCVPAFNAGDFLAETIESVLAQTIPDWELVIFNNNSSDHTLKVARSYDDPRIRIETSDTTLPMDQSWNRALSYATAPYVKLLCADDILHHYCLERQVGILEQNPDVALVAARRDFIDEHGNRVAVGRGLDDLTGKHSAVDVINRIAELGTNPIGCPSALLCRAKDLQSTGLFDGEFPAVMDLDLSVRLLEHGDLYGSDQSLSMFRISKGSATATLSGQGGQYRTWLEGLETNSIGPVSLPKIRSGKNRSRLEDMKRVLLFWATNSRLPGVARLPNLVMPPPKNSPTRHVHRDTIA